MLTRYYVVILITTFASGCAKVQMTESDARVGLAQRLDALKNLMVVYDVNDIPDDAMVAKLAILLKDRFKYTSGGIVTIDGTQSQKRFCRLNGMFRYESKVKLGPPTFPPDAEEVYSMDDSSSRLTIISDGLTHRLVGYNDDAQYEGMIKAVLPQEPYAIDEPWGLRWGDHLLTEGLPPECRIIITDNRRPELRITGVAGWHSRWVLDSERGYAPVLQENFAKDGRVLERMVMKDWRQVSGVWVAYRIERTAFISGSSIAQVPFDRAVFTVKSCRINSTDNTPSLYQMVWPKGTELIDRGGF